MLQKSKSIFALMAILLATDVSAQPKRAVKPMPPTVIQAPLELKGVRIGMTLEELRATYPAGECGGFHACDGGISCLKDNSFCDVGAGTVAGVETSIMVSLIDQRVANAYLGKLHPPQFEIVFNALVEKFGKPSSSAEGKVQNRMGNSFDNPSYQWNFPDGKLLATKFTPDRSDLLFSQVEISSTEWLRRKEEKAKAAAHDL